MFLAAVLAVPAALAMPASPAAAAGEFTIIQLAVGQGDSALFRGPCGDVGLLDAGDGSAELLYEQFATWDDSTQLRWVASTHYEADHIGDMPLINAGGPGVTVGQIFDRGGGVTATDSQAYAEYYAWAKETTPFHAGIDDGDGIALCQESPDTIVVFTVMSSGTDGTAAGGVPVTDENDKGLCFKVEYHDFDMATCGDLNGSDEGSRSDVESAVAPLIGDVEVLKVNQHGSAYSSNSTFISALKPNVSIVSVGQNSGDQPDPGVLSRLSQQGDVFTTNNPSDGTPLDGHVTVRTTGADNFTVSTSASRLTQTYAMDGDATPAEPGPAPGPTPDEPGTKRLAGTDRYSTAAAIVQDSFPAGPIPVLFVATGAAYADALAGGPAADVAGGPILPVAKASIPDVTRQELERLAPSRIVVLGGSGAVSDGVVAELRNHATSGSVTRVAGINRYDTAARVATQSFTGPAAQVMIATGGGFADALAGGAVGAKTNTPVLLVSKDSLPPETAAALRALRPNNISVLGGTGVVSDAVLQQLRGFTSGGVTRLAGDNRYSTAARIVQVFWPQAADVVYLATGHNFPDALAGVPAAGRDLAPLLLVERDCMPAATKRELDRLQPSTVVVLGGTGTVSTAAASGTVCATPAPAPAPPAPTQPADPGDTKNCSDFATEREAQAWFDKYYPYYGDVAKLDADNNRKACESLP